MTKTTEKTPAVPHDLILESRSKLTLTGVKRVLRCDADSGEVRLTGRIDALEYTAERTPGGFLRRLLR